MSIESALWRYLLEHASLRPLVQDRIYRDVALSERLPAFPYLTLSQSGENPEHYLLGFAGITNARLVLEAWCETAQQRDVLAAALQTALPNWSQTQREGVMVRSAFVVEQVDAFVPPTDSSERGVFQRSLDLDVWYRDV